MKRCGLLFAGLMFALTSVWAFSGSSSAGSRMPEPAVVRAADVGPGAAFRHSQNPPTHWREVVQPSR